MRRNAVVLCAGLLLLLPLTLASSAAPSPWVTARPPTDGRPWGWEKAGSCLPLAWEIETVDDSYGAGWDTSLELDAAGRPHICYSDFEAKHGRYAYFDGSAWHIQEPDPGTYSGSYCSLALDAAGRPHIAYYGGSGNLKYAVYDGSAWQLELADPIGGYFTSLALDATGQPYISHFDWSNYDLRYARRTGAGAQGTWEVQLVDGAGVVGDTTSLVLDAAGLPRISYHGNGDLRYAVLSDTGWLTDTVDQGGEVGYYSSQALDGAGRAHIASHDWDRADLRYAYHDGTRWVTATLDSLGYVGEYASLALDTEGRPRISYFDRTSNALKYACFDGSDWHIATVTSPGGAFTSLELDAFGRPHISYQGAPGLVYAHAVAFSPRAYLPLILRANGR
jgi:hypothetical protein